MSTIQLPIRTLAASIGLLAIVLCSILASPAQGETLGAAPAETVAAVAETATDVPAEAAPVEASSAPAPAPTPVTNSGSGTAAVPVVEEQVANVVTRVTRGEAAGQVKEAAEETVSAATAPVKSVADAANVQPTVDKVVESASYVRPLPDRVAPGVSPASQNAPSHDPSRTESAFQIRPEQGQAPLPGPAPQLGGEIPSPTFENALPLETQPMVGWIDGLNLREALRRPGGAGPTG